MTADERWADALAAWAIPEEILARAPQSPWGCDVTHFTRRADEAAARTTPAADRAIEALTRAGEAAQRGQAGFPGEEGYPRRSVSVLDVGCGAGAATVPLLPLASRVTGVDTDPRMLSAFLERALRSSAESNVVEGRWPDVAGEVDVADVVVCHDVLYNVPDAGAFIARLTDHARIRVVVVVPETHPQSWTAPYWQDLHALQRPTAPTVDDLVAVVREGGHEVVATRYREPTWWAEVPAEEFEATLQRRLCLPPERREDLRAAIARHGAPAERTAVALWWDGSATRRARLL
jgi:2-polyprenyl-3-methyl-5-hydroxy-6-metoxy-1,4-benzoquinol methylase